MRKHNLALALAVMMSFAAGFEASAVVLKKANTVSSEAVEETEEKTAEKLSDGEYSAVFTSDSAMFKVNEACDGRGVLTVEDGVMILHISLVSKNIVHLYPGLAKDAKAEDAVLLEPTEDTVTYADGMTGEVYGFDVPVPMLNEEFDLALIGTHGNWYDHKVTVTDPIPLE